MEQSVVDTNFGKVRGVRSHEIHQFKGIPYAGSTGGPRRFRPPVAPEPWTGERDATLFGPSAPQLSGERIAEMWPSRIRIMELVKQAYQRIPRGPETLAIERHAHDYQGEDCLVLNVWTPEPDDASRPVMVHLHGGGWFAGSGSEPKRNGENLAQRGDVVVVTINHRLGLFGYLNLAEWAGEDYHHSGYVGVLDLVAALRWIRDNIRAFGGDPENVMIFGTSGGAEKVLSLLALPDARGLFHRAAIQSGVGGSNFVSWEHSLRTTEQLMSKLGVGDVDALSNVPVSRLLEVQGLLARQTLQRASSTPATDLRPQFHEALIFGPTLPSLVGPDYVSVLTNAASTTRVPLLIGSVKDETTVLPPALSVSNLANGIPDDQTLRRALHPVLGKHVDNIVSRYRSISPASPPEDIFTQITSDHGFRIPAERVAEHYATANNEVYMYFLSWRDPNFTLFDGKPKSVHGMDVPLVMGNVEPGATCGEVNSRNIVSERMSEAWIAFARHGRPEQHTLPQWPTYDRKQRLTMIFDDDCHVEADPGGATRSLWQSFNDGQFGLSGEMM